jgi:CPA1 family monovalent cation:H+ antiporter
MQLFAVWELLLFILNAILFLLVGLQLPTVLDQIAGRSVGELAGWAALVSAAVIAVRLAYVWITPFSVRLVGRTVGQLPRPLDVRQRLIIGWSGMRGSVALAAALAIPLTTDADARFPERDLIVFLAFCVILGTLVLQGLSLPLVIRTLKIEPDHTEEREDAKARIHAAEAALARLEELLEQDWVAEETAERLRGLYGFRRNRFASRFDAESDGAIETQSQNYQRLRRELLDAERAAVTALGRQGVISGDVVNRVRRDLDLEDARLDA